MLPPAVCLDCHRTGASGCHPIDQETLCCEGTRVSRSWSASLWTVWIQFIFPLRSFSRISFNNIFTSRPCPWFARKLLLLSPIKILYECLFHGWIIHTYIHTVFVRHHKHRNTFDKGFCPYFELRAFWMCICPGLFGPSGLILIVL